MWKLEFQDRGAPHFHVSTTPPMGFTTLTDPDTGQRRDVDFKVWLSVTWAEIVAHPDPEQHRRHRAAGTGVDYAEGIKLTDPRRMAIYFAKYGTGGRKDYQHRVPREWLSVTLVCDGCGREYDADLEEAPAPRLLLSVEDAADQLALSRTRLYSLIKSGEIVSVRIGRLRRVPVEALAAFTARLIAEQSRVESDPGVPDGV